MKRIALDVWLTPAQLARLCALALEAEIEPEYVRELIRRLRLQPPEGARELGSWPWRVCLHVLGPLEAIVGDGTWVGGRAHRRPLEILAVLVALGRNEVPDEEVASVLWPDSEGDRAHHALETALYRLRGIVGEHAIVHRDGMLGIDPRECWVDAVAVDALMTRASAFVQRRATAEALECAERAVAAYRGPFVAHGDAPWVLSARDRLRDQVVRVLSELGRQSDIGTRAAELLDQASGVDPSLRSRR